MSTHSVEIRDLDLYFNDVPVLQKLNLDVREGEFLVLLGSSGCGKSTLLNCIAGLLDITEGQVFIKGENVTWKQPSERGIGMVFQSYALYPQMTVAGNLSFGLKNARLPGTEIRSRVARAAEILQIEPLLHRKPAALSGGQRQRVAIGRALVRDADVFLFDEPLSNLDAKLRTELRVELKRLHQRLQNTMIYVTHDQVEAMTLADRIAIMKYGKIMQLGSPDEIYNRPQNTYVADFIGTPAMNMIAGRIDSGKFVSGMISLPLDEFNLRNDPEPGSSVTLGIRPEHIMTNTGLADGPSAGEVLVELVEKPGSDTLVYAALGEHRVRVRMDGRSTVRQGDRLHIGLDTSRASLFDGQTGLRL